MTKHGRDTGGTPAGPGAPEQQQQERRTRIRNTSIHRTHISRPQLRTHDTSRTTVFYFLFLCLFSLCSETKASWLHVCITSGYNLCPLGATAAAQVSGEKFPPSTRKQSTINTASRSNTPAHVGETIKVAHQTNRQEKAPNVTSSCHRRVSLPCFFLWSVSGLLPTRLLDFSMRYFP